MIQQAQPGHLEAIHAIAKRCGQAMRDCGIYQWNEAYPARSDLQKDIDHNWLYICTEDATVRGSIVVHQEISSYYNEVKWLTPTTQHTYVHRLMVDPEYWGQQYGQQLMDFAENKARQWQSVSVRLDTFSQNKRNQRFYEQRGYKRLGEIFFPKQSEFPFYCYEKVFSV